MRQEERGMGVLMERIFEVRIEISTSNSILIKADNKFEAMESAFRHPEYWTPEYSDDCVKSTVREVPNNDSSQG